MIQQFKTLVRLVILLFTLSFYNLQAQAPKGNHPGPPPAPSSEQINEMVNDLSAKLSLSKDQKEKVLALYIKHFDEQKDNIDNARELHQEMEKTRKAFENDIKTLLSEEQKVSFNTYMKNQRKQHGDPHKPMK